MVPLYNGCGCVLSFANAGRILHSAQWRNFCHDNPATSIDTPACNTTRVNQILPFIRRKDRKRRRETLTKSNRVNNNGTKISTTIFKNPTDDLPNLTLRWELCMHNNPLIPPSPTQPNLVHHLRYPRSTIQQASALHISIC